MPDGGSIAVVANALLDPTFWAITDLLISSNFDVVAIRRVIVYPRQKGVGMHDVPKPDNALFRYEPGGAIGSVVLETGLGTLALKVNTKANLELSLITKADLARPGGFNHWTKNDHPHPGSREQAIEYNDPAVLIDTVTVDGQLFFERKGDRCRVDVWFDTVAPDPFKQDTGQAR
jgi:hypothetical protein